jgi:transcriptional regulator with GAF, ATPase, and Fis domain
VTVNPVVPIGLPPCWEVISRFLERVLPGQSERIKIVRDQVLQFALNQTARSILLSGPIGSGKSTIARCIALLKRVAVMTASEAESFLELAPFSGPKLLDIRYLSSWYREMPLTGLVESLADLQLFGSSKGTFTGAIDRAGIFESASTGQMRRGDVPVGAAVTGGVVFLDEIGDLAPNLQTKLLPVLSGGVFYRLGTEGHGDAGLHFNGIVITASWRRLDGGRLRPDLLSRIAPYTIVLPGIDERIDDFDSVVADIEQVTLTAMRARIDNLLTVDKKADREYWWTHKGRLRGLDQSQRDVLRAVPWGKHGNLRGLTAAVEQIMGTGIDARLAVARLPRMEEGPEAVPAFDSSLLDRLLARPRAAGGLAANLRDIELEERQRLQTILQDDPSSLRRLAASLGVDESKVKSQLRTIARARRAADREP